MTDGSPRRLVRSDDRWLAGVCAGLADYLNIDANLVRVVTAIAGVFSFGSVVLVYLIAWALMPSS